MAEAFRVERDTMGEMRVPTDALYGAQTARAVENFPISGLRFQRQFIRALALIKSAAARVNGEQGHLPPEKAAAIERAAEEVLAGAHDAQFVVDMFQTGSGTSTNMNANEVIGRLAGAHPNDDVNRGQSSNDVIPSALHIAAAESVARDLFPAMDRLHAVAGEQGAGIRGRAEDRPHALAGRGAHAAGAGVLGLRAAGGGVARADRSSARGHLRAGAGRHGGGHRAQRAILDFARAVIGEIARRTELPFVEARNHFEAQAAKDAVVFLSGALRAYAVALTKIANDIRWLGSGPRCGLGELRLPAVQPGSSIMPGKVNPVIAESLLMVCAQVIGYDATIAWSRRRGQLRAERHDAGDGVRLLESIELLAAASRNFAERLVEGLEADGERAGAFVEQSLAMGTALAPEIGYDKAAALVKEAYRTGKTVREVAREKSGIPEERLQELLDPARQAGD